MIPVTLAAVLFLNIQYVSIKALNIIRILDWLSFLSFGTAVPRLYNGHFLTFFSSITLRMTSWFSLVRKEMLTVEVARK